MAKKARDGEAAAIGGRIRQVRQAKRLTLEQLAEAAETSVQFLSQVEKGEQSMTMVKFAHLATALGMSSDYLLYGREEVCGNAALAAEYLGRLNPIDRDMVSRLVLELQRLLDASGPEV